MVTRWLCVALLSMSVVRAQTRTKWAVAVHGGAGEAEWEDMTAQAEAEYKAGLQRALDAASKKLSAGAPAIDAVQAAIMVLEDDPNFNAGRGSAFNAEGKNEMDASIMNGADLSAGAVAGVQFAKNPIQLARAVMEHTPHVMLAGPGADAFAKRIGVPTMPASYFFTEARWREFIDVMKKSGRAVPPRPVPASAHSVPLSGTSAIALPSSHKFGTVGAVARDIHGNLAAGTSTGGMQGKMPGRIGDSPIIGAATYADNRACAVSSTGAGEYFIRLSVAKEICSIVKYQHKPIAEAAHDVIHYQLTPMKGGEGGVIVLNQKDDPTWEFNTLGMFRARQVEGGLPEVTVR